MAPLSNYISFLFLSTLMLPLQISARDSQFFSKVTHFDNKNAKVTEVPNKEAAEINKAEQQPAFIPETENSYGLYGHDESNQLPSTTPISYHPYKTEFDNTNKYYNNDAYNTRFSETGYNNNNRDYNKDSYGGNQFELSDTKYSEEGYNNNNKYYKSYQNNNQKYNNQAANDKYYNNNYNTNSNRYSYNNNPANDRYNGDKQGMSDTRYLEGGKYYYDISAEKYNPTNYGDSSKGVNTNNWNNNRGGNYNGYQNQEDSTSIMSCFQNCIVPVMIWKFCMEYEIKFYQQVSHTYNG
ncbi:Protein E6, partial [Mucuna pruriens]